ncbi:developmentally regulated protein [Strigomonas culicis]|uniref:Developmentally regulated protein n=1 Tax=Strigomonas culicis TaxID=28005 RepID=S9V459_9TRYP|nr:developmentally regulated protein [Strigomonas culicis]|eukprot:EPY35844.1 developmentally regulated protein [Strigomonas culicis]
MPVYAEAAKWWKLKEHRRIKGARGARFASLGFHGVFIVSMVLLVEYVFRSTEDDTLHLANPPVPPPPPMRSSLTYAMSSEMPHLKSMELERQLPAHVPQTAPNYDASIASTKKF